MVPSRLKICWMQNQEKLKNTRKNRVGFHITRRKTKEKTKKEKKRSVLCDSMGTRFLKVHTWISLIFKQDFFNLIT